MEAISRSCLPAAAARTKRQRKATCCGVLGTASHRTTCARSSTDKLTSGLILAMRTYISYSSQYVYLFMIHTTSVEKGHLYGQISVHRRVVCSCKPVRIRAGEGIEGCLRGVLLRSCQSRNHWFSGLQCQWRLRLFCL